MAHGQSDVFNLGNGAGFSVQAVIDTARRVTGKAIPIVVQERRTGDPAVLMADSAKARAELGWEPRFDGLEMIIKHAWMWEQNSGGRRDQN